MKFFKSIEKLIVRLSQVIMVVSLSAMVILGFLQVILRNFFNSGFPWADIVIRNLVLWLGFAGAIVATSKGRHIAIGALLRFVPDGFRKAVHFVVSIASSVVCLFLSYASINFITFEKESAATLVGNFPQWIAELIIPVTFCFLTYQFLIHALDKPPEEEVPEV